MERKDVRNLAEKLSSVSGLDSDSVYAFLMAAGRYKSKSPTKLDFTTGDGIIFLTGERDNCYLERYTPKVKTAWTPYGETGIDYEGLILARQERYMD